MGKTFLGSTIGTSILWKKDLSELEISVKPIESVILPVLIAVYGLYFSISTYNSNQFVESAFGLILISIAFWSYAKGRRRVVLMKESKTVRLLIGKRLFKELSASNLPIIAQKARIWNSGADGPVYLNAYVFSIGDQQLLSVSRSSCFDDLTEAISRTGFFVEIKKEVMRVNL
jgi:hypothetical protein